jgi:hypothetical protein
VASGGSRRVFVLVGLAVFLAGQLLGQDVTALRINEIMSSNQKTLPTDLNGDYEDLLEIYNPTDQTVSLRGLLLASTVSKDPAGKYTPVNPWRFPTGAILPRGFVLVFCDGDGQLNSRGEAHANFKLKKTGELVALFTPAVELIDLVVFPQIASDTSYGRFPDGSGDFCHTTTPSFKNESILVGGSLTGQNNPCANIPPEIELHGQGSLSSARDVNPAAGVPLSLVATAWDEKEGGVARVTILYQVDGGPGSEAVMELDLDATALLSVPDPLDASGQSTLPDRFHSVWRGQVPGQPAGSVVTFTLKVEDAEGGEGFDPAPLCGDPPSPGCKKPYRYRVAYEYRGPLVLNEVCPRNVTIIKDLTDQRFDDYMELTSSEELDLTGLWLSGEPFHPEKWQFPLGSRIQAGQHLIVWCDKDERFTNASTGQYHISTDLDNQGEGIFIFDTVENGLGLIDGFKFGPTLPDVAWSRIPDGDREAPFLPILGGSPGKPNATRFLRGDADHGGGVDLTDAILVIDYLFLAAPPPVCADAADADNNDALDLSDPIAILNMLFLGTGPLPPPGPQSCGPDPTPDGLGCTATC